MILGKDNVKCKVLYVKLSLSAFTVAVSLTYNRRTTLFGVIPWTKKKFQDKRYYEFKVEGSKISNTCCILHGDNRESCSISETVMLKYALEKKHGFNLLDPEQRRFDFVKKCLTEV